MGLSGANGHRMVPAKDSGYLSGSGKFKYCLSNPLGHDSGVTDVGLKKGGGVDTQLSHIQIQLPVVVLQGDRSLDDSLRTVTRSSAKGSGAVNGNGNKDGPRRVQPTLFLRQSQKVAGYP